MNTCWGNPPIFHYYRPVWLAWFYKLALENNLLFYEKNNFKYFINRYPTGS